MIAWRPRAISSVARVPASTWKRAFQKTRCGLEEKEACRLRVYRLRCLHGGERHRYGIGVGRARTSSISVLACRRWIASPTSSSARSPPTIGDASRFLTSGMAKAAAWRRFANNSPSILARRAVSDARLTKSSSWEARFRLPISSRMFFSTPVTLSASRTRPTRRSCPLCVRLGFGSHPCPFLVTD